MDLVPSGRSAEWIWTRMSAYLGARQINFRLVRWSQNILETQNNLLPTSVRCIVFSCRRMPSQSLLSSHRASYLKYDLIRSRNCAQFNRYTFERGTEARTNDVDTQWSNSLLSLSLRKLGNWRCELCVVSQKTSFTTYQNALYESCHYSWMPSMHSASEYRARVHVCCVLCAAETGKRLWENVLEIISIFRCVQRIVCRVLEAFARSLWRTAQSQCQCHRQPVGERARVLDE